MTQTAPTHNSFVLTLFAKKSPIPFPASANQVVIRVKRLEKKRDTKELGVDVDTVVEARDCMSSRVVEALDVSKLVLIFSS